MSADLNQQLHDRATRGEPLSVAEQAQLEQWYASLDQAESQSLAVGKPLGVAAELALAKHAGFDLQSALAGLISHGAIAATMDGLRWSARSTRPRRASLWRTNTNVP